jgi:HK97 family phage major capsid protein
MGLAENIDLYAILSAKNGIHTVAGTHVIADDDVMATYFGLFQEYRDGAVWIMGADSVAELRWMLIATPRAYGSYPDFGGGEFDTFMGKRLFENRNWLHTGAGIPLMTIANLPAGVAMVEHSRGLQIFVDPYTLKGTGWVLYYPSARWDMVLVQTNCHQNLDAQA